ncbi:MAG: cytochrome-c peroxidase, partial [Methylocystaceae bacterium]
MSFFARAPIAAVLAMAGSTLAVGAFAAGADNGLLKDAKSVFAPLPSAPRESPDKVRLGRQLFFETRVSADGNVGCVHCHQPDL